MPRADDDDRKQQPGSDEVREPKEERTRPQKRLPPEEAEALREPRPQPREVGLAFLLERRPHSNQRESRERVRNRVDEKWQRAGEPEERTPERRPGELHRRLTAGLSAGRRRELPRWNDRAQRACIGDREEGGPHPFDEGDQHDRPVGDRVEQDRRGEPADRENANPVGREHQPLAVPAVSSKAGRQRKHGGGQRARESDDACLRRGAGHSEHEQRVGDRGRLRPGVGKQLPGLEQHEVAVAAQRNRGHVFAKCHLWTPGLAAARVRSRKDERDAEHQRRDERGQEISVGRGDRATVAHGIVGAARGRDRPAGYEVSQGC